MFMAFFVFLVGLGMFAFLAGFALPLVIAVVSVVTFFLVNVGLVLRFALLFGRFAFLFHDDFSFRSFNLPLLDDRFVVATGMIVYSDGTTCGA